MREDRVRSLLRDVPVPGEDEARERAWPLVREAFELREPAPRRPRPRLAVAVASVLALAALALTPPGQAVSDWVRDEIGRERTVAPADRAALALPAGGRLLVSAGEDVVVLRRDGSKRRVGRYDEATWSPRGLFIGAARGSELFALEEDGSVRWSLPRTRPLSGVRWSPSGFRIAYLAGPRTGFERAADGDRQSLRVVAGDGTGDRQLAARVAETPPAWRPGGGHVLAYADPRGRIVVRGADSGRVLWRSSAGRSPDELAWSPGGDRLAALGARTLRVYSGAGRLLAERPAPGLGPDAVPSAARRMEFAPGGGPLALVRQASRGRSEVALLDASRPGSPERVAFAAAGAIDSVSWSPDGRWLAIGWPTADQLVFVRARGPRRVLAVAEAAGQFAGRGGPAFPVLRGWCCPP